MIQFIINSKKYGKRKILIDKEDIYLYNQYKWCISKMGHTFYVTTNIYKNNNKKWSTLYLHKLIYPTYKIIDHINHNGLDNRRSNLRGGHKGTKFPQY